MQASTTLSRQRLLVPVCPVLPCRLLEISGAKEPSALEALVKAMGVKPEAVNRWEWVFASHLCCSRLVQEHIAQRQSTSAAVKPGADTCARIMFHCRDLLLYKGILSKLSAAKELLRDFLEREKKRQAEREAEKAARAAKEMAGEQA